MRFLITAGPTREPIDPVRYIGNRSSGKMGAALAAAALKAGHETTVILGPVSVAFPKAARIVDVETAAEMLDAVLREFSRHDLLVMAAAVADYRPVAASAEKLARQGPRALELESTVDVVAAAGAIKRPDQRTLGFSLESIPDLDRVRGKMRQKNLDLIVYNPIATIASDSIRPSLLYPDGRLEAMPYGSKADFADMLIQRAVELFR
ncbi:MAG: phosphopantothenoylcysteine decarboxylase [Tepidisphaeraceae bacterium]|jgi:phosphopantothenoylcysteine decarboxylase/phosphopantothenate--cysteine ligase